MPNQDWSNLGDEIKNIVQSAVESQNFKQLNESITRTINTAMDSVNQGLKQAGDKVQSAAYNQYQQQFQKEKAQNPWVGKKKNEVMPSKSTALYAGTSGMTGAGLALSIVGGIFTGGLGIAVMSILLTIFFTGGLVAAQSVALAILIPFLGGSIFMAAKGGSILNRMRRFKQYVHAIGNRTYCSVRELADHTGRNDRYVLKDVKDMIRRGMFRQGHTDKLGTCLIVSNETYEQYHISQQQLEQKQMEQTHISQRSEPKDAGEKGIPEEAKRIIEEGNRYLEQIRACNLAIPGEEMSAKISRMEVIIHRIFSQVERYPELTAELRKFMEYYLPTTVKLLDAYRELDAQPVQGSNITSSKKEIEGTLDTINQAFENLLDGFFKDKAWDISSDISVLQTMLAQEGLTNTDFSRSD